MESSHIFFPGATITTGLAIVEFADGIKVIDPTLIKFEDEEHDMLCYIVKMDSERRGNKNA